MRRGGLLLPHESIALWVLRRGGALFYACLRAGMRGDCLEAAGLPLPLRACRSLAQGQERDQLGFCHEIRLPAQSYCSYKEPLSGHAEGLRDFISIGSENCINASGLRAYLARWWHNRLRENLLKCLNDGDES